MSVRSIRIAISILLLCGVTAVTAIGGLRREAPVIVDEWLPRMKEMALHAPVDYGPGPGRGRPTESTQGRHLRPSDSGASGTPTSVKAISLSVGGSYFFAPTCTIGPPDVPGGQQATCAASLYALTFFSLGPSGTGYKAGDALTMMPMPGLTCGFYPLIFVKTVDPNGVVTSVNSNTGGLCSSFPTSGTYTFSGGSGTGYTIPAGPKGARWRVAYPSISGGSGYINPPSVTFQQVSPLGTAPLAAAGTTMLTDLTPGTLAIPAGGQDAATKGVFGSAISWPINAIHVALLPDGRVLNFGSDQLGLQGAFIYDVWDPGLGTGTNAHMLLPVTTQTDIFCGNATMLWRTGQVLATGGDLTLSNVRGYANNKTTIFDPRTNAISPGQSMHFPRWYVAVISLPDGDKLALGGTVTEVTAAQQSVASATIPEVFDPVTGWRLLSGINLATTDWYYPRAWVAPAGNIFHLLTTGQMMSLTTDGVGKMQTYQAVAPVTTNTFMPTVMFAPGKILALRDSATVVIDINGPQPIVTPTQNIDQLRQDASGTVLADGEVVVTGGSAVHEALTGVAYTAQLWNPATGIWTTGPAATKPRLYHSNALLLQDGSVLTVGGGSPGPVVNLNAEIYYPPYLYMNDGSGNPAPRPAIQGIAAQGIVGVGQTIGLTMADASPISRVTLVHAGAATHANNAEQRFIDVTPTLVQNGQQLSVTVPSNPNIAVPGYYLVFVFNQAGTPSIAQQVLITSQALAPSAANANRTQSSKPVRTGTL